MTAVATSAVKEKAFFALDGQTTVTKEIKRLKTKFGTYAARMFSERFVPMNM